MMSLTTQQLEVRKQGVGASEVAAALGLSRYLSQQELFLIKTGREVVEDRLMFRFGHAVEPFILDEFERERGVQLVRAPDTMRDGLMLAHLDAWRPGEYVVQAKTARSKDSWGAPGTDAVPQEYILQVNAEMLLSGCRLAFVPVLFGGADFAVYEVPFDAELAEMAREGVREFWQYVEADELPPIDTESDLALDVLRKLYPGTDGSFMHASAALEPWKAVWLDAAERVRQYQEAADGAKAHLLAEMKAAAKLTFADGSALTRKLVTRKGYEVAPATFIDCRYRNKRRGTL